MALIEIQESQETAQNVPVTARQINETLRDKHLAVAADASASLPDRLHAQKEAAFYDRLAQEPTTDELRAQAETVQPKGIKRILHKIGASALR